jgi:hypothetical protein
LTLSWLLTAAALLIAGFAILRARRVSKRLEGLTESYWELRYEIAQVRARVGRLEPPLPDAQADPESRAPDAPTAFVPLSSLKRP